MTPQEAGQLLFKYAEEGLVVAAKTFIEQGMDVLPVMVTIDPAGEVRIYGFAGTGNAGERQMLKEMLVQKDKALAIMLFSDAWSKHPETMERIGEGLQATIETNDGNCFGLFVSYTRDPLTFAPVQRNDQCMTYGNTFHIPTH